MRKLFFRFAGIIPITLALTGCPEKGDRKPDEPYQEVTHKGYVTGSAGGPVYVSPEGSRHRVTAGGEPGPAGSDKE